MSCCAHSLIIIHMYCGCGKLKLVMTVRIMLVKTLIKNIRPWVSWWHSFVVTSAAVVYTTVHVVHDVCVWYSLTEVTCCNTCTDMYFEQSQYHVTFMLMSSLPILPPHTVMHACTMHELSQWKHIQWDHMHVHYNAFIMKILLFTFLISPQVMCFNNCELADYQQIISDG